MTPVVSSRSTVAADATAGISASPATTTARLRTAPPIGRPSPIGRADASAPSSADPDALRDRRLLGALDERQLDVVAPGLGLLALERDQLADAAVATPQDRAASLEDQPRLQRGAAREAHPAAIFAALARAGDPGGLGA